MKKGIHFDDTFSPCTRLKMLRLITVVAINNNWNISHADVPNAYLHGECENLIFTRLPNSPTLVTPGMDTFPFSTTLRGHGNHAYPCLYHAHPPWPKPLPAFKHSTPHSGAYNFSNTFNNPHPYPYPCTWTHKQ